MNTGILINDSRCDSILQHTLINNISSAETLQAVHDDLADRMSVLDEQLQNAVDENSAECFSQIHNFTGPRLAADDDYGIYASDQSTDHLNALLFGKRSIIPGDAPGEVPFTELQYKRFKMEGSFSTAYKNYITKSYSKVMSIFPEISASSDAEHPKLSSCTLCTDTSENSPKATLWISFENKSLALDVTAEVWVGEWNEGDVFDWQRAVMISVQPLTIEPDSLLWQGHYVLRWIPTDYNILDHHYSEDEFFELDDVFRSMFDTSDTYEILSEAVAAALQAKDSISDFVSGLQSKFKEFSATASAVLDVVTTNGFKFNGVLTSVKAVMGALNSGSADSDGRHVTFVNNGDYVPKGIFTTVIGGILQGAGALLTLVGGFVGKIIGVIALVTGSLIKKIGEYLKQKADATLVLINEDATVNCFSAGLFQTVMPLDSFSEDTQNLIMYNGSIEFKYVGCTVIMFISDVQYDVNGQIDHHNSTVGVEIHPGIDVQPTSDVYNWFKTRIIYDSDNPTVPRGWNVPSTIETRNKWEDFLESQSTFTDSITDMSRDDVDEYVRKMYLVNWLFCLFIFLGSPETTIQILPEDLYVISSTEPLPASVFASAGYINSGNVPTWTNIMSAKVNGTLRGLYSSYYISTDMKPYDVIPNTLYHSVGQSALTINEVVKANLIDASEWWGDYFCIAINQQPTYLITPSEYKAETFWLSVMAVAAVAIATVAIAVVGTMKMRRKMNAWNAKHQAKVESAWNTYTQQPTDDNYNLYKTAVRRNNWLTRLTGGTKYSYTNYWGDTSTSDSSQTMLNRIQSMIGNPETQEESELSLKDLQHNITSVRNLIKPE